MNFHLTKTEFNCCTTSYPGKLSQFNLKNQASAATGMERETLWLNVCPWQSTRVIIWATLNTCTVIANSAPSWEDFSVHRQNTWLHEDLGIFRTIVTCLLILLIIYCEFPAIPKIKKMNILKITSVIQHRQKQYNLKTHFCIILRAKQHRERPCVFHQVVTRTLSLKRKKSLTNLFAPIPKRVQMNH